MNYRKVYKALSIKDSVNILMEIYNGCLTENFKSFKDLKNSYAMSDFSLRRITNRLSSSGLIKSVKASVPNKRARVFVVSQPEICERIKELTQEIMG